MAESQTISLGGEDIALIRPKGRAGRKYIARVQEILSIVTPAMDLEEGALSSNDVDTIMASTSRLFIDESLKFEDEILPGLYIYSEKSMTKDQAIKKLDEIDDSLTEILMTFINAAVFWITPPTRESKEALDEAVKKSEGDQEEEGEE